MLEELKQQVCEANQRIVQQHLVLLTFGNVSGVDREKGMMAIKPSGVGYADLKPSDMVLIDLEGTIVEGELNPSSDAPTHLVLYRSLTTIGGITHTHSTYATMFAQACRPIPALGTTHADQFHGEVPITRPLYKREVEGNYEVNTGAVIVDRFAKLNPLEMPAVLVAHHGPFTWGRTPADAVYNSVALEAVAKMAFGTLFLSPSIVSLPPFLLDKHFLRKHGPEAYYGQGQAH